MKTGLFNLPQLLTANSLFLNTLLNEMVLDVVPLCVEALVVLGHPVLVIQEELVVLSLSRVTFLYERSFRRSASFP